MSRDSAVRAARTAATGAQNAGRLDSYYAAESMGIKLKKEWLATLDGRTRHEHAMLDGQQADTDKPFKIDGYELMFPGDPAGAAEMIYNCRCTLVAAVDGVPKGKDVLRRDQYGVVPDMTYAQWEASKRGAAGVQISTINTKSIDEYRKSLKNQENIGILKEKIATGEISTELRQQMQKKAYRGNNAI
jgi:uncharacterized protein with gpF-like domain